MEEFINLATLLPSARLVTRCRVKENDRHSALKRRAVTWLEAQGLDWLTEWRVEYNYSLDGRPSRQDSYIIDVLGISSEGEAIEYIPIECGDLPQEKAVHLAWSFPQAYHWPYGADAPYLIAERRLSKGKLLIGTNGNISAPVEVIEPTLSQESPEERRSRLWMAVADVGVLEEERTLLALGKWEEEQLLILSLGGRGWSASLTTAKEMSGL